jgi:hypothetical protein
MLCVTTVNYRIKMNNSYSDAMVAQRGSFVAVSFPDLW